MHYTEKHKIGSEDGATRGPTVFAVVVVMVCLSTTFVSLRFVSRVGIVKRFMLDDYFMALAWLLAFGMSFAICFGTANGLGRHEIDVPGAWQSTLLKSQYVFSVLYNPTLMAEKTSILVFYLSLSKTNKTFRWATIATLFVVNAAGLALTIVTIVQCNPVSATFTYPTPDTAHCTDIVTIYLASAPVNIITDLAILFLPMPILTSMRLPKKQKIILVVTFGFGVFVAVVDIIRIANLQAASTYRLKEITHDVAEGNMNSVDATDFSWYSSFSFMWSAIEVNLGIMCACVPALKPLVSRYMPKLLRHDGDITEKHSSLDQGFTFQNAMMIRIHRVPSMHESAWLEQQPSHKPEVEEEPVPQDSNVNMMDFLTTPDMNELQRSNTALTNSTRNTSHHSQNFFDFVNMKGKKSFVQMSTRESLFPVIMVTILFFIWGFEYGLLDVLNEQFQDVSHMSASQTVSIHSAYYAGYFLGPLTFGRLILKHYGFAACYTVGLAIYACGILIFWPAAVLVSFPTFVVVNVLVGLGLSTLEISANPFIALCGPVQYAEIRLCLSQGFQAIGTVIAPLIARKALFKETDAGSLLNTQWTYTGIALFTVVLAVAFFYVPLPEGTDIELEERSERMDRAHYAMAIGGRVRIVWIILAFGAFAMWCYVGAQEVIGTELGSYLEVLEPSWNSTDFAAIGHGVFAASRFIAAGLCYFVKPRHLLAFYFVGLIIFGSLATGLSNGRNASAMLLVAFFFEGPIFPLVFVQTLRGMGRHTKEASAVITAAISGGSVLPAISYVASASRGYRYSMVIAVAGFAGGLLYPIILNFSPLVRAVVDPIRDPGELPGQEQETPDNSSRSSIATRALSLFSLGKKKKSESIKTEWRERGVSVDSGTPDPAP
ncbi:major facilitator superfamily domain-containing protein [Delphinella strobiligena]|nr:major facilitator superfamily domain-containing protein [Delphinella strobiligena]